MKKTILTFIILCCCIILNSQNRENTLMPETMYTITLKDSIDRPGYGTVFYSKKSDSYSFLENIPNIKNDQFNISYFKLNPFVKSDSIPNHIYIYAAINNNYWIDQKTDNLSSSIITKLKIKGFPTYMIIDKTGKIVYKGSNKNKTEEAINIFLSLIDEIK